MILNFKTAIPTIRRRKRRHRATIRRQLWLHRKGHIVLTRQRIEHYLNIIAQHHSADHQHLAFLRHTLCPTFVAMAESWRCRRCWKVLSGKHAHCPHCGGRWDRCQDTSFIPPERHGDPSQQTTRWRSPHGRNVQWKDPQQGCEQNRAQTPRGRSGSASNRKRRPRGKKKNEEALPQYAAPAMPAPWKESEDTGKGAQHTKEEAIMSVQKNAKMMQALKETDADKQEMPESIKKMVKEYDVKTTEQLTKEMHKASTSIGQSRKLLYQLQDTKIKHRKSWFKHLTTLMSTLEKQYEAFETQQKDYQDRIQKSRRDTRESCRTLQRLNVQAAEATIPETVIEEDDTIEPPLQDAEEMELRMFEGIQCQGDCRPTARRGGQRDGRDRNPCIKTTAFMRAWLWTWIVSLGRGSTSLEKIALHVPAEFTGNDADLQADVYSDAWVSYAACSPGTSTPIPSTSTLSWTLRPLHSAHLDTNCLHPFLAIHNAYLLRAECQSWPMDHWISRRRCSPRHKSQQTTPGSVKFSSTAEVCVFPEDEIRIPVPQLVHERNLHQWTGRPWVLRPRQHHLSDRHQNGAAGAFHQEFRTRGRRQGPDPHALPNQPAYICELAEALDEFGDYDPVTQRRTMAVLSWFVHGRHQRENLRPRVVYLNDNFRTWTDSLKRAWRGYIVPTQMVHFHVIHQIHHLRILRNTWHR